MKICANCAYYSPTSYNGEVVDYQGCCTHIAFYKTGMARVGADGNLCDWQFREQRTKPPKSVVISLLEKGYLWVNTLSCRQRYVICPHYHHPITYLKECMERGICSEGMLEDKLPLFKKFLNMLKFYNIQKFCQIALIQANLFFDIIICRLYIGPTSICSQLIQIE